MLIREFVKEDAYEVSSLIRRSILERDNRDYSLEQIYSIANYYSPDYLLELDDKIIHVATEQELIIGMCMLKTDQFIIYILPGFQKKGIGSKLMDFTEKIALKQGLKKIWGVSTLTAVGFYKKIGYIAIGEKFHPEWGKGIFLEKTLS